MDKEKMGVVEIVGISQALKLAKAALEHGPDFPVFGPLLKDRFHILNIYVRDNSLSVEYEPEQKNQTAVYSDIVYIMGFLHGLLADDLESLSIHNIGVQAIVDNKPYIFILSPIESVKAIKNKNIIYWLKNSIIEEPFRFPKKVILLVEGPTEVNAFPLLFSEMGFRIDAHNIDIFPFAENNLETLLIILKHNKEKFYLVCDKDKEEQIFNLRKKNLLNSNYHLLKEGEFEDYVSPEDLVRTLTLCLRREYIQSKIPVQVPYLLGNFRYNRTCTKIDMIDFTILQ